MKILLVGSGGIAPDYIKALKARGIDHVDVLGRNADKAQALAGQFGCRGFGGGGARLPDLLDQYDGVILAASIDALLELLAIVYAHRPDMPVLVEKPVGLASREIDDFIARHGAGTAMVALNRLYFPSISHLRTTLASEPPTSASFSFTEWVHRIDASAYSTRELARWGLSNCIHVTSTVFDLIGLPQQLSGHVAGRDRVDWHPSGAIFAGAGMSRKEVAFSYHSDWTSAGRWSINVHTHAGRYELSPMEALSFTPRGSVKSEVVLPMPDTGLKVGFAEMLDAWLAPQAGSVRLGLVDLVPHIQAVETMFGYEESPA